tara:strand:+ start:351 stop:455 length:105 start_codon:yes stop_codon:yes gene_type:complete
VASSGYRLVAGVEQVEVVAGVQVEVEGWVEAKDS